MARSVPNGGFHDHFSPAENSAAVSEQSLLHRTTEEEEEEAYNNNKSRISVSSSFPIAWTVILLSHPIQRSDFSLP
ncbi:hypothetical protein Ddye_006002 [Dipteronia dyeriana]|uniref:Uncharacterized protein n=1 Tax=Dipteronia dyeriana TaxID=168575 RepID=A0AAE0CQ90_9ROSI|nr:hypothetical protein Ddye_006002 [Dipteronia dyeriana]